MSGILDKKIKFIDLVVTEEGRRQMSQGGFRPTFASFSDKSVDYNSLQESTEESSSRIYLQTPSKLFDDKIVYETDDSGKLLVGETSSEKFKIIDDELFELDTSGAGTVVSFTASTGSGFASTVELVKDEVLKNFQANKFVRTVSGFEVAGKTFKTSIDSHTFVISNSVPFPKGPHTSAVDIDDAETFMFDSKLGHNKNFQFLPPVNKDGTAYGSYQDLRSFSREDFDSIKAGLNIAKMPEADRIYNENTVLNYEGDLVIQNRAPNLPFDSTLIAREHVQIQFVETSEQNNFITQMFEENPETGKITKLDIVDAGEFLDEIDAERPTKHVFYVGKILFDSNNIPTFVNMFTLVMD